MVGATQREAGTAGEREVNESSVRPLGSDGSGARRVALLTAIALLLIAFFELAPSADALTQRPFKETFGSAGQPAINGAALAIDLGSGDVLVATEEGGGSIQRFHADGTPAPFSKLGTNVIDGKRTNDKTCSEEPASCDETPRKELKFSFQTQIAVDESGGLTDGDIYFLETDRVDIFAPSGAYLGVLTGYKEEKLADLAGIAVGPDGAVYITDFYSLRKFVPKTNPVGNEDGVFTSGGRLSSVSGYGAPALGAGPTAGSIFIPANVGENKLQLLQVDSATGEIQRSFAEGVERYPVGVDPQTGTVLFSAQAGSERIIQEWDAASTSEPRRVGRIYRGPTRGLAVNAKSEAILTDGFGLGVYGTPIPVPTVTAGPATGITGTRAILSGEINPNSIPITGCRFEYGETPEYLPNEISCDLPPTDSSAHRVEAEVEELEPNGHTYYFRLVATVAEGREESAVEDLTTAATVVTKSAGPISTTEATLNGLLRPEGEQYTGCYFEYGINTNSGFERRVPCIPRAGEVPQGYSPQAVSVPITGLQAETTYRYKVVATTAKGTREGEELTFATQGAPQITDVRALGAEQGSATLEGKVNPSGFGTSYRFEWGPTAAYGHRVPADFDPFLGTGETPIRVTAQISGLSTGAVYHYRIVATSPTGITASPDHIVETLNACGLPEGRCFELVSRADTGPFAIPGEAFGASELQYQVDPAGGRVTYPVEFGYPEARRGAEVLYRAARRPTSWQSTELSPPLIAQSERRGSGSESGQIQWLSDDLSCGFLQSSQPLTADPAARQVIEEGGLNYYRLNSDGSYTAVTRLAPENLDAATGGVEYSFVGASQDCRKVIFETAYRYPGVPAVPVVGQIPIYTYEWNEGALRALEGSFGIDKINVVSEDGSRVFFDNGTMLENGLVREYANSPSFHYQWATSDGSKVFFTAESGLATEASGQNGPEGTDLYEYDVETGLLRDRTVVHLAGGAQVEGLVGASKDGSVVYFGSHSQLLPGRGPTLKQNEKANTESIYEASDGTFKYVGASSSEGGIYTQGNSWTSQVSPDGRYLLFQSRQNVTGYVSGGAYEAYLFDGEASSDGMTTCVSCRQDGLPSTAPDSFRVLRVGSEIGNEFHRPQYLVVREGRPEVFFSSTDGLAPHAVVGQKNIYEWVHDQVFRLASAPAGTSDVPSEGRYTLFAGASADGEDVFLSSHENLSREDLDGRLSVFDARVAGGFPEPPAPPANCVASIEGSCIGLPQLPPASSGPATAGDSGTQNFQPKKKQCKKNKKKCGKKKQKHTKKKQKHKKGGRKSKSKKKARQHDGSNRRAGK